LFTYYNGVIVCSVFLYIGETRRTLRVVNKTPAWTEVESPLTADSRALWVCFDICADLKEILTADFF